MGLECPDARPPGSHRRGNRRRRAFQAPETQTADTALSYRDIVILYSTGNDGAAWSALTRLLRDRVDTAIATLLATPHEERTVEAAAMLHSDLAFYASGSGGSLTAFDQFEFAQRLVRSLRSRESSDFRRHWYAAASGLFLKLSEIGQARRYADEGRRAFGEDASLWLLTGAINEADATLSVGPPTIIRDLLSAAESAYRKAILLGESGADAHLRLGRVLHLLNRAADARHELSRVIATAREPRLLYLAHLFAGRIAHDAGDYAGAAREFEAACTIDPDAQTPYVALSDAAEHRGRHQEAREYAERLAGLRQHDDGWWDYTLGGADQFEPAVDWLRKAAHR